MLLTARDAKTGQALYAYRIIGVTPQGKFEIKIVKRFQLI
jgi:hypothetical protein